MNAISTAAQFGLSLIARRKQLKLTQTQIAARIGLSQNRVSELETNPHTITLEQLLALINLLGLELRLSERAAAGKQKPD